MLKTIEHQLELTTNSKKDLVIVVISIVLLAIFSVSIDLFDLMIEFTREHEDWELDEYILTLLVMVFPVLWYSLRRFSEIYKMKKSMERINSELNEQLSREIEKSNKLLKEKNKSLEDEIAKALKEAQKKDEILHQQSKLVAMGEMIESIAHQWKQPLSVISTSITGIKLQQQLNILKEEDLKHNNEIVLENVQYLSKTIDDFRDFFNSDKRKNEFDLKDIFSASFTLVCSTFKDIRFVENIQSIKYSGFSNELIQVIINILNNARDEIKSKELDGLIFVDILEDESSVYIKIKDNAEGIKETILDKIFDAHFSTKEEKNGSGIGLYMSRRIIQKSFNGTIQVENCEYEFEDKTYKGALFSITLPKEKS